MKFFSIAAAAFFAATVSAQGAVRGSNGNCGFPNGPTCVSVGKNDKGQTLFTDPANSPGPNCCLFPARCGNGDGVAVFPCVFVGGPAPAGKSKAKARKRRIGAEVEA
ncbi:hypothetical protein RB595_002215 [Gaeumannomyces hyphopodioides]